MQTNVVVSNWAELMNAPYDIPRSAFQRYRSNFVYRGVADHSWGLEISLQRLCGDYMNVEGPMLRSFRKNACARATNSGRLVSSHVSRDPSSDRGLWVRRAEEVVRTTGPSRTAVAGREIVAEDICARDLMFLEQPADQRCGSGGLRRSERKPKTSTLSSRVRVRSHYEIHFRRS